MAGNVWEWTLSLWGRKREEPEFKYPYDPTDGREDLRADDNVRRVVRGGAFYDIQGIVRCAFRDWFSPHLRGMSQGFRVVVSPL